VSDDDIAELKRMRDRGEITGAQYEVLRRHVLWGTTLPEAVESLAGQDRPAPYADPPGWPASAPPYSGPPTGDHTAVAPPPFGYEQEQPAWPPPPQMPHVPPTPPTRPASGTGWGEAWWEADRPAPAPPPRPPAPELPAPPSRRSRRRGRAAFLLSLLLAVALIGAGAWWFVLRKPAVAPADYARMVCSHVQAWHDDMTARSGQLQQALNSNDEPEATRTALASFFDQVAARTGQLRTDIDGVGAPAISGGKSYVDGLDHKLDDTAGSFRDAAQKSRDLNVEDRATFTITVQVLQSQVDQLISGVDGALANTSTPGELRTAYNNASGCAPFTG
jgi:hypothetical protein